MTSANKNYIGIKGIKQFADRSKVSEFTNIFGANAANEVMPSDKGRNTHGGIDAGHSNVNNSNMCGTDIQHLLGVTFFSLADAAFGHRHWHQALPRPCVVDFL